MKQLKSELAALDRKITAEKQQNNVERMAARKAAKIQYLQDVKAIVGPEQYVVFLENFYVNGNNQGGKSKMQSSHKSGKNFAHNKNKKGRKGDNGKRSKARGDKQANRATANQQTAQL